jgi:hypothetical protein
MNILYIKMLNREIIYISVIILSGTRRAKTFQVDFLATDHKSSVRAGRHRQGDFRQAMCTAAVCAGKVGMTLLFCTVKGQLEMRGSFIHKRLMNQPDFDQTLKRSINGHFIEMFPAAAMSNLVLAQWFDCLKQNFQYCYSVSRAVKFSCFEHFTCLYVCFFLHDSILSH